MKTKISAVIFLLAALVVAGCSSPSTRIKHNPQLFATISAPDQELIKQGQIAIGFTPDMVKLALGEPDYIARKIDRTGTSEIWRYRGYDSSVDTGYYGYYGMGGYRNPYWGRGWGGYYGGYYGGGWGGWGWGGGVYAQAPQSDYMRVTMREGRVIEINQLR